MRPPVRGVALVTGAAQGLGLATARRLAQDGFTTVLADRDGDLVSAAAAGLRDEGLDTHDVVVDVTDDAAVEGSFSAVAELAAQRSTQLAVLVNNAGTISRQRAEDFVTAQWELELSVNLGGTMRCSRGAYPLLLERVAAPRDDAWTGPAVVNLASVGSTFGLTHRLAYATAKTGVLGLTRTLAAEWGRRGVRVNAVAPGYMESPMMLGGLEQGVLDRDRLLSRTPMMRFGRAEEVASAISFLVSRDASFVTGACLPVDGGITIDGTFHCD